MWCTKSGQPFCRIRQDKTEARPSPRPRWCLLMMLLAVAYILLIRLVQLPLHQQVVLQLLGGEGLQHPEGGRLAGLVERRVILIDPLAALRQVEVEDPVVLLVAHLGNPALGPQLPHDLGAGTGGLFQGGGQLGDGDLRVVADQVDDAGLRLVEGIFPVLVGEGVIFIHQVVGLILGRPDLPEQGLALVFHSRPRPLLHSCHHIITDLPPGRKPGIGLTRRRDSPPG